MKELIKRISWGFVTGLGIALGALAVFLAKDYFDKRGQEWYTQHNESFPEYIKILEYAQDKSVPQFTVRGKFKNTSKVKYTQIGLATTFGINGALVNVCKEIHPFDVSPDAVVEFAIECQDMESNGLPNNLEYKVLVEYAMYVTKKEK